jgi:hypothetical protein
MLLELAFASASAIASSLGPPEPESREQPANAVESGNRPARAFGRMPNWFGPAVATGLTARDYGRPGQPPTAGQLAAATIVSGLQGRLAGYSDRHARGSRTVTMLLPELMVALEFGGTLGWRDAVAEQRGLAVREGVSFGVSGLANIGVAWATPGIAGIYARVGIAQRFSARTNANLEGPYWIAALGPSTGLRVAVRRELTLLVGGGVEGSVGVQRFDDRGRLIAQLAPIAELGLYTQPRPDLYFGLVAHGDLSVLGQRYGGQRMHGRATAEVAWELSEERGLGSAGVLLVYEGTRIDAVPGHPQFDASGERRISHQLMLSGGFSF